MIRMPQLAHLTRSNAINAAGLLTDQVFSFHGDTRRAPHASSSRPCRALTQATRPARRAQDAVLFLGDTRRVSSPTVTHGTTGAHTHAGRHRVHAGRCFHGRRMAPLRPPWPRSSSTPPPCRATAASAPPRRSTAVAALAAHTASPRPLRVRRARRGLTARHGRASTRL